MSPGWSPGWMIETWMPQGRISAKAQALPIPLDVPVIETARMAQFCALVLLLVPTYWVSTLLHRRTHQLRGLR